MNELQKHIVDVWIKHKIGYTPDGGWDRERVLSTALSELTTNTSAFCLMPEWMQKAMKLLPAGSLQMVTLSGKWYDLSYHKLDSPAAIYRMNPAYVFEEDYPEHIADMESDTFDCKVFSKSVLGETLLEVECDFIPRGYLMLYQVTAIPGFIAYVYEPGASIKVPERTLFDKPRIYCYHRGITLTPTHVRFKKGN